MQKVWSLRKFFLKSPYKLCVFDLRNEFTLPPEVVLFEPSPGEIFRGGTPAPQSKSGNRLIFLNVPLLDFEQAALNKLHEALKNENTLAPGGTMPSYVRLHALRLLQQAKWKVEKALHTIATHLEMLSLKKVVLSFLFLSFHPFHNSLLCS